MMYYSHSKSIWYCTECNEVIKSPRTANTHATSHDIGLPCSRKKPEPPKPQVKEYSKPAQSSVPEFRQTVLGSPTGLPERPRNYGYRNYSQDWNPAAELRKRESEEFSKKLQLLMLYRDIGFTEGEMQQAKIDLGFAEPPDEEEIRKKEELKQRWQRLIAHEPDPRLRRDMILYYALLTNDPN